MQTPIFITGNQDKADYLAKILGVLLEHQKLDLDEIQSLDVDEIITHKVKQAYAFIQKPVLVEDVWLGFTALHGLPGPFIKFFVGIPDGLEKLCRLLDGFTDRSAEAGSVYGYYDGQQVKLFRATMAGSVPHHPRGKNGFGWDAIFEPVGYGGKTRAELSLADYEAVYEIVRPYKALRNFLT